MSPSRLPAAWVAVLQSLGLALLLWALAGGQLSLLLALLPAALLVWLPVLLVRPAAAESAGAVGGVEQSLAHQFAAAHHQAMTMLAKASVEPNPTLQMQFSALSAKWMAVASNIALTLKKLKASGEQRITIQHVNVSDGGQAVIGDVRAGG